MRVDGGRRIIWSTDRKAQMLEDMPQYRPYAQLARIYDELVGDAAYDCWKDNFERLVNRFSIQYTTAADIACGTGMAVVHLAARASRVYAVDRSMEMLDVARSRDASGKVAFIRQSFNELELPEKVDLLTCNFDSLNYITDSSQLADALARFGRTVRVGGHAFFDMNTARELEAGNEGAVMVHRLSAGMSVWESSWDPVARVNTLRMTNFISAGDGGYSMSEEIHVERAYDLEDILRWLLEAGFGSVRAFDAKGLCDIGPDTRRVQFLARR